MKKKLKKVREYPLICPMPWQSITVLPNQTIPVCCAGRDNMRNRPDESALETFRGAKMTAVRKSFLKGKWPKECRDCESAEQSGQFSKRQDTLRMVRYQEFLDQTTPLTDKAGSIVELDLSFGRLCNLKCRMCSEDFSSKWKEDAQEMYELEAGIVYRPSPMESDADVDSLIPHLKHCKEIVLKGGEPMLQPRTPKFLNKVIAAGYASQIKITLVTNLTTLTPSVMEALRQFREVMLVVSVDGPDPVFRYIRHGRFTADQVRSNMIIALKHGFEVMVNIAFSIYNMLHVSEIVHQFRGMATRFSVSYVVGEALNPQKAPALLRNEAIRRLRAHDDSELEFFTRSTFNQLIQFLEKGEFDPRAWQLFIKHTEKLDELRDESISKVLPEIARLMKFENPDAQVRTISKTRHRSTAKVRASSAQKSKPHLSP